MQCSTNRNYCKNRTASYISALTFLLSMSPLEERNMKTTWYFVHIKSWLPDYLSVINWLNLFSEMKLREFLIIAFHTIYSVIF